jgi:starch synthase
MTVPLKIAVLASEAVPFVKTGGLADVAGGLPKALCALGHDAIVILPKYS